MQLTMLNIIQTTCNIQDHKIILQYMDAIYILTHLKNVVVHCTDLHLFTHYFFDPNSKATQRVK